MPRRRYDEEWMYSRSRTPSAIRRARQLVITSLATLRTAALYVLVRALYRQLPGMHPINFLFAFKYLYIEKV